MCLIGSYIANLIPTTKNRTDAKAAPIIVYGRTTSNCLALDTPVPAETIKIASEYKHDWLPSATPDMIAAIIIYAGIPVAAAIGINIG